MSGNDDDDVDDDDDDVDGHDDEYDADEYDGHVHQLWLERAN